MLLKNSDIKNPIAKLIIQFYQATVSYFLGGNCRYYPTCSYYASEAFEKHSFEKAAYLTAKRVLSCHPFSSKQYYDPVPIGSTKSPQEDL